MKKLLSLTIIFIIIMALAFPLGNHACAEDGFTQKDRELLIELRVKMVEIDKRFEQIDKRFEQVDKRFEQVDKRFEQVDKRFEELREDMNKRFEQVDKRFEQMFTFLWILTGIFTTLTVSVIGFAYWDRRTIIGKAKEETISAIEKDGKLRDLINALRTLAENNKEMANVLRRFNLL
ncbi:MAG: hypothetical protein HZA01_01800 [Nitrospinae bacterium]|nr:hypothetical protein [Nitrospinota bacterium]